MIVFFSSEHLKLAANMWIWSLKRRTAILIRARTQTVLATFWSELLKNVKMQVSVLTGEDWLTDHVVCSLQFPFSRVKQLMDYCPDKFICLPNRHVFHKFFLQMISAELTSVFSVAFQMCCVHQDWSTENVNTSRMISARGGKTTVLLPNNVLMLFFLLWIKPV